MKNIKHIIVVSAGKGGVGKSTISANISVSLSKLGKKVGLLDADIYGPSIPKMFGENSKPKVSDNKKILPFNKFGIKFMSIGNLIPEDKPVIWRGAMVVGALNQLLKDIEWGEIDFLIIDLPPGTGDVQLSLCQTLPLSGALVVSTPQEISLIDVRRAINMFKKVNVRIIGMIQNMSYLVGNNKNEKTFIFGKDGAKDEAKKQGINFLGDIPINPKISQSSDNGKPISEDKSQLESKIFLEISEKILNKVIKNLNKDVKIEVSD